MRRGVPPTLVLRRRVGGSLVDPPIENDLRKIGAVGSLQVLSMLAKIHAFHANQELCAVILANQTLHSPTHSIRNYAPLTDVVVAPCSIRLHVSHVFSLQPVFSQHWPILRFERIIASVHIHAFPGSTDLLQAHFSLSLYQLCRDFQGY